MIGRVVTVNIDGCQKGGGGEGEGAVETNESIDEVDDSVTKAVVWPVAWLTSIS